MSCTSDTCASACASCAGSGADVLVRRQSPRASTAPLSTQEVALIQEYEASVGQRRTVKAAEVPSRFVCKLARSQS